MATLQDDISHAETIAQEAQQRLTKLKNEASRDAAKKLFMEAKLRTCGEDSDKLAIHYSECHAVTRWLGRTGNTPKESLKYFPLPVHSQASVACPGCACEVWLDCLQKSGYVH